MFEHECDPDWICVPELSAGSWYPAVQQALCALLSRISEGREVDDAAVVHLLRIGVAVASEESVQEFYPC
jgi:hypothetical protein